MLDKRLHLLRKNPIFYKREFYLNLLEKGYKGNEFLFFENLLMLGDMLHYLHGFMYREKKLRTQDEVVKYYLKLFNSEYRGDRIMRENLEDLKLIMSYYE